MKTTFTLLLALGLVFSSIKASAQYTPADSVIGILVPDYNTNMEMMHEAGRHLEISANNQFVALGAFGVGVISALFLPQLLSPNGDATEESTIQAAAVSAVAFSVGIGFSVSSIINKKKAGRLLMGEEP